MAFDAATQTQAAPAFRIVTTDPQAIVGIMRGLAGDPEERARRLAYADRENKLARDALSACKGDRQLALAMVLAGKGL